MTTAPMNTIDAEEQSAGDVPNTELAEAEIKSRSQLKRDDDTLKAFVNTLFKSSPKQWARLDLTEEILEALHHGKGLTKHIAKKRQRNYIAGLLRVEDVEAIYHRWHQLLNGDPQAQRAHAQALNLSKQLMNANSDFIFEYAHNNNIPAQDLRQKIRTTKKLAQTKPDKAISELANWLKKR